MTGGGQSRRCLLAGSGGFAFAVLAACVPSLGERGKPPRVYRLSPKTTFPDNLPRVAWALAVAEPLSERALDTDRIALARDGFEIVYFADALWADRVPALLQLLVVQSVQASGAVLAVGTDRDAMRPDFLLRTVLQAFHVIESADGGRRVRVSLSASLLRMPWRRVVAVERFAAEQPVAERSLDAIVFAFDEALGKVLKRLVLWVIEKGEESWSTRGPS